MDIDGESALKFAQDQGHDEVISLLTEALQR